jgi:hypothetical protein
MVSSSFLLGVLVIIVLLGTTSVVLVVFGAPSKMVPGLDVSIKQSQDGAKMEISYFNSNLQYSLPSELNWEFLGINSNNLKK